MVMVVMAAMSNLAGSCTGDAPGPRVPRYGVDVTVRVRPSEEKIWKAAGDERAFIPSTAPDWQFGRLRHHAGHGGR
jgi:hypothetical protein